MAFRILGLVVDARLLGELLADLCATLFRVLFHVFVITRNECG